MKLEMLVTTSVMDPKQSAADKKFYQAFQKITIYP